MNATTSLLAVQAVSKHYRRGGEVVDALRHVTFDLGPGQLVGLVGPSGAGKSTLLNVIMGWERPDGGTVVWRGSHDAGPCPRPWHDLAVVPQRFGLLQELTIGENARLPLRLGSARHPGGTDGWTEAELLSRLGLRMLAERRPADVSLGEQQRAAIARALILSPRLALVDEPTRHQDEDWRDRVLSILAEARGLGTTTLVATHDEALLEHADSVLALRDGRLVPPTLGAR